MIVGGAASALFAVTTALGDGPGMLLYTSPPAGGEVYQAPFRAFRAIGRAPQADETVGRPIVPAITRDGRVVVFAPHESMLLEIPDRIDAPEQVVYCPLGFCMARGAAGQLWVWGSELPAWSPDEPLRFIDASQTAVGGIAFSGTVHAWNLDGPLAVTGAAIGPSSISLANQWGAAVSASGELQCFSVGPDGGLPPIGIGVPIAQVSVAGSPVAPRAVVITAAGTLRSLVGSLEASGNFERVSVSKDMLVALAGDGLARQWRWTGSSWSPGSAMPGVFSDVAAAGGSAYLVLDGDANRDDIEDAIQILAGEVPDANGDMLDDRAQARTVLFDENGNGELDRNESPGVGDRRTTSNSWWYESSASEPEVVQWSFATRVPAAAEPVNRITLRHAGGSSGAFAIPVDGLPAEFALWIDPSGEGDPRNLALLRAYPIVLKPTGRTVVDLGGVSLGRPGSVVFFSLGYAQPPNRSFVVFPASPSPAVPGYADSLRASRLRSRAWWKSEYGDVYAPVRMAMMRGSQAFEQMDVTGPYLPHWSAVWGDRGPRDCNGDGVFDWTGWHDPHLDANVNGVIDSCEQDCDGDGEYNFAEIVAGATDCDRDLIPDICTPSVVERAVEGAPPSAGAPVEFWLNHLPPAATDVVFTVEVIADLGSPAEFLLFQVPGMAGAALFADGGRDCPSAADVAEVVVPAEIFNAAVTDGSLAITLSASGLVSAVECPDATLKLSLVYATEIEDCDGNGIDDSCQHGWAEDCNGDSIPDACQLGDSSSDADRNGILDACEFDCDGNGILDRIEIEADPSIDCDETGYLDFCELIDCNFDGLHDPCQLKDAKYDCNTDGIMDACQPLADCNADGTHDACQVLPDCDGDGVSNACEISDGAIDKDGDGIPDACEHARGDFDLDGEVGSLDLSFLLGFWDVTGLGFVDLDDDGVIAAGDLAILLANWGPTDL